MEWKKFKEIILDIGEEISKAEILSYEVNKEVDSIIFAENSFYYFESIFGPLSKIKEIIYQNLKPHQIIIIESTSGLEWAENRENWSNSKKQKENENFLIFIEVMIDNIFKENNSLEIKVDDYLYNLDLENEEDISILKSIHKLIKDELLSNNNPSLENQMKTQLNKLTDLFTELDNKVKIIDKQLSQNELQGIIDAILSLGGPLGSAVSIAIKGAKKAKRIKHEKKLLLSNL